MEISIKWFDGQYPSFNVNLHSQPGKEEFISIKGCRIVDGRDGPFVSWPSTKNDKTGKYWNHVWAGEKFAAIVLSKALEAQPKKSASNKSANQKQAAGFDDLDSDIPW